MSRKNRKKEKKKQRRRLQSDDFNIATLALNAAQNHGLSIRDRAEQLKQEPENDQPRVQRKEATYLTE